MLKKLTALLLSLRTFKRLALKVFVVLALVMVLTPLYTYTRDHLRPTPVLAAVGINHQISFQGKLVNTDGTNVTDGSYSIVFSIYTVASAGTNVWTETQTVTLSNGIFQVNLGSVTTLPASVDFNTDNIYLGIKVGADAEMTPRVQFTAVPQAFNAEKLGGLDKTGFIQNGTTLQPSSNFNIQATSSTTVGTIGGVIRGAAGGQTADLFQLQSTAGTVLSKFDSNGNLSVGTATSPTGGVATFNGNVGIGTPTPSAALHVVSGGNLVAKLESNSPYDTEYLLSNTSVGGRIWTFRSIGSTGPLPAGYFSIYDGSAGADRLIINTSGNVGIGTSGNPSQLLSVGGTTGNFTVSTVGAIVGVGVNSGTGLIQGTGGLTVNGTSSLGAINTSGNFAQSGTTTFATGTGTVSLNGNTDIAATASLATKQGAAYTTAGAANNVAISTASLYRLDTIGAAQTITGIVAGRDGQHLTLVSADASLAFTLNNLDAASSAANQISTGTGTNLSIPAGSSVTLIYDATSSLWRVVGSVAGGSGTCNTCANTSLSNLSTVAINTALLTNGDNLIDLGSAANSFRTLYADTSVLSPTVDTATAVTLNLGTNTASAVSLGRTGVTTTNNGALTVTQALTASSTLAVSGTSTFTGLSTFNGGVTVANNSNFSQTGTGTFGTGTGAVTLNGATSVSGTNTFAVGTGATTLGGTLGVTGALTGSSTIQGTQLISTVGTGTAPLTVASTTRVNNLNTELFDSVSSFGLAERTRAQSSISGGGTVSWIGTNFKWTTRFIVIANGQGSHFSTDGYFDIYQPTSGTITGVGGAANVTATASGIPLGAWTALYYILPIGSNSPSLAANFRVATYTAALQVPSDWILLAVHNGDNASVRTGTGQIIRSGGTSVTGVDDAYIANSATLQTGTFNINGTGTANNLVANNGIYTGAAAGTLRLDSAGALSNITTLGLSGAITGATSGNTINGLIINTGAVSGATTINASGLISSVGHNAGTGLIQGTGGLTVGSTITFGGLSTAGIVTNTAAGVLGTTTTVPVANGGSGAGTFTANGIIFGNGTGAFGVTAAGTTGQCLLANTSAAPSFGACGGGGGTSFLQGGNTFAGTTAGDLGTNNNGALNLRTNNTTKLTVTTAGDLTFSATNPIINAGSYITIPGGLYVSGGLVYAEGFINARGGLRNDTAATLTVTGGTSGYTNFTGNVGIGQPNPARPLHISSNGVDVSNGSIELIDGSLTSTTNNQYGFRSVPFIAPSAALGGTGITYTGVQGGPATNSVNLGTASNIAGVNGAPYIYGTAVAPNVQAGAFVNYAADTATITNSIGVLISTPNKAAGATITNNTGLRVDAQTTGSQNIGLAIGDATGTNQTNLLIGQTNQPSGTYSIYNSSPDQNYFAGATTFSSGGQAITLNGATSNYINYGTNGVGAPSFTTRSVGTKLVLNDSLGASAVDYGFGIEGSTLWSSVPNAGSQFKFYGGTTQAALLTGTGNLTLAGTLSVNNSAAQAVLNVKVSTDNNFRVRSGTGTEIYAANDANSAYSALQINGSAISLNALSSGNVGIGTGASTSKLELNGDLAIVGGAASTRAFTFGGVSRFGFASGYASPYSGRLLFGDSAGGTGWKFAIASGTPAAPADLLTIQDNGQVGIGTTTPNAKLQVGDNADAASNVFQISTSNGANAIPVISFFRSGSIQTLLAQNGTDFQFAVNPAGYTSANITAAAKLTIQSSGNVGIGTTAPADKLSIYGGASNINIGGLFGGGYNSIFLNGGTANGDYNFLSSLADKTLYINRPTGNAIQIRENNVTQATFTSGGGLVVGTGIGAWGATDTANYGLDTGKPIRVSGSPGFINFNNSAVQVTGIQLDAGATPALKLYNGKLIISNNGSTTIPNLNAASCDVMADTTGLLYCGTNGGGAGTTLQGAYTASAGGTTPEIKLDSTRGGVDIQDANVSIGTTNSLLAVRSSNAAGLGSALFSVLGSGNVGIGIAAPTATLHLVGPNQTGIVGADAYQTLQVTGGVGGTGAGDGTFVAGPGGLGSKLVMQGGIGGTGGLGKAGPSGNVTGGNGGKGGDISLQGGAGGLGGEGCAGSCPGAAVGATGAYGNVLLNTGGGNVGIGNSAPVYLLQVGSGSLASGTPVAYFYNAGGSCTITPNVAAGVTCTSDRRLKKDITNYSGNALDAILGLQTINYRLNAESETDQSHVGFIAQDFQQLFPDLTSTDKDGYLSVSYGGLTPYLARAIQQQQAQINALANGSSQNINVSGTATINNLVVTGTASLKDLTVSGTATIGSLNVVNSVTAKDLTVTGTATIEKLVVKDVEVTGSIVVKGGITTAIAQKKANYTAVLSDSIITADASAGNFTVTLPTATGIAGRQFTIKKTDTSANPVIVNTTSTVATNTTPATPQTIDGAATYNLPTPYKYIVVVSDGTNWIIVGNN